MRCLRRSKRAKKVRRAKVPKVKASDVRRQTFAEHVAIGKSATEAARLAGYKAKGHGLEVVASRLLRHVEVQASIKKAQQASSSDRILSAQRLQEMWSEIAAGGVEDAGIPARLSDRLKAMEMLGKVKGMFIDRVQNDGKLEITVRRGNDAPAALQTKDKP